MVSCIGEGQLQWSFSDDLDLQYDSEFECCPLHLQLILWQFWISIMSAILTDFKVRRQENSPKTHILASPPPQWFHDVMGQTLGLNYISKKIKPRTVSFSLGWSCYVDVCSIIHFTDKFTLKTRLNIYINSPLDVLPGTLYCSSVTWCYSAYSGFWRHHQRKMSVLISGIIWLYLYSEGGSGHASSIFISHSLLGVKISQT